MEGIDLLMGGKVEIRWVRRARAGATLQGFVSVAYNVADMCYSDKSRVISLRWGAGTASESISESG
jgi:hypothetical protein